MMLELVLLLTLHTFVLLYLRSAQVGTLSVLRQRSQYLMDIPIQIEGRKEYKLINAIIIGSFGLEILFMGLYGHQHALMLEAPVGPVFHSIVSSTYLLLTLMVIVPMVSIPLLAARLNVLNGHVADIEKYDYVAGYEERNALHWFVEVSAWADENKAINSFMKEQNAPWLTGIKK